MSRRKRSDAFSEAIVGLFMIAVLALLVYFTIVISGVDVLKGRQKVIAKVAFTSVGGLKDHDSVMYRGTKVGGVEGIDLTPSNLIVRLEIDESVVLRESYTIAVCSLSMLGGQFLKIEEGEGAVVPLTEGILRGETPTDWMQDVSRIAKNLNELTGSEHIKTIITNIEAASASAKEIARRLEEGEGTLGKLLSQDNSDLKESVAAFKKACEQVKLPENMDKDVAEIMDGAKDLVANLTEVSEKLKNGEGTLGKLTTDAAMYDELQGLIKDVRQVLDNYRDTTPISTFGSLIMGGL